MTARSGKARLLREATTYIADHGVAGLTLRRLASEIGTSHRMLLYHFGSKEGLLIEVIRAVEARQLAVHAAIDLDPSLTPTEVRRRMWEQLVDPAMWANERLFFELYGQALQGRGDTAQMLDGIVESWLEPVAASYRTLGLPPDAARAQARVELALSRGLLLDLLATGDRAGVDRAAEQFNEMYEVWVEQRYPEIL